MDTPRLTVIMPVYNTARYLAESIESILGQTFGDFEFLIFNDGSSDNSLDVIKSYKDPRIRLFNYDKNSGYLVHLNEGIRVARGEYIARMDSDDVSLPRRFEKQIYFMERNEDVGLCGTQIVTFGAVEGYVTRLPTEDQMVRTCHFFHGAVSHPTVMMRASVLKRHGLYYDEKLYPSEDYKMWLDISRYSKLYNIPEVLLKYRTHSKQVSRVYFSVQNDNIRKMHAERFREIGIRFSEEELDIHNAIWSGSFTDIDSWEDKLGEWFLKLNSANRNTKIFPEPVFSKVIAEQWFGICMRNRKFAAWIIKTFFEWPILRRREHISISESVKLALRNAPRLIFGKKVYS